MGTTLKVCFVLLSVYGLMSCGSSKKMSADDYSQLPAQERIQYLNTQAAKNPNNVEIKKQLYREYLNVEMRPQAIRVMEDILRLDPTDADVLFEYGELQYAQGNSKEAYQAFLSVMQGASAARYQSRIAEYVASGYGMQQITFSSEDEAFPSFSPDSRKLIYQKKVSGNWDIVEYDLSARSEKTLVSTPADEECPVYSPAEAKIVYTTNADDRRPIDVAYKVREIVSRSLSDGFVSTLTQTVADDWLPRYSHDGAYIVFVSDRNDLRKVSYDAKQSDIFIMESGGAFQRQLTNSPANEGGACLSADDRRILFHSDRNGQYDIFEMRTDGKQVMTIIDHPNGNDVNPFASADGQYLTFVSDRDGNFEIYRARSDGSQQERLTFDPGVDANPVFSPDGKSIAFHSNRNGNYNIFLINLNTSSGVLTSSDLISRLSDLAK